MGNSVLITGSTGMVGKGVLLECLADPTIERVVVVNRSSVGIKHDKLTEVLHQNFHDISSIKREISNIDACFFCLGVSSFRMPEDTYHKLTYDLTIQFAETFKEVNPNAVFCYVSGVGTDSTEKGRSMWARVKGKTENKILSMFDRAYMFRPGYIQPLKGIRSKTPLYDRLYLVFKPLYYILKHFPSSATNTENFGRAMIAVLQRGYDKQHLGNREINDLAKKA